MFCNLKSGLYKLTYLLPEHYHDYSGRPQLSLLNKTLNEDVFSKDWK